MRDNSVSDHRLPPDLVRLETLEIYLAGELRQVRDKIARLRAGVAAQPARAHTSPPGAGTSYVLSFLRVQGRPAADSVHLADCHLASQHTRQLTVEQARRALAVDGVAPCQICRPDAELGILD